MRLPVRIKWSISLAIVCACVIFTMRGGLFSNQGGLQVVDIKRQPETSVKQDGGKMEQTVEMNPKLAIRNTGINKVPSLEDENKDRDTMIGEIPVDSKLRIQNTEHEVTNLEDEQKEKITMIGEIDINPKIGIPNTENEFPNSEGDNKDKDAMIGEIDRSHISLKDTGDNKTQVQNHPQDNPTAQENTKQEPVPDTSKVLLNQTDLGVAKVLFLTFYRGGSTLVGEVFDKDPDAFYWFEPLAGLLEYNQTRQKMYNFLKEDGFSAAEDGFTLSHFPDGLVDLLLTSIVQILNCDYSNLDKAILRHYFVTEWKKSQNFNSFATCIKQNADGKTRDDIPADVVTICLPHLSKPCLNSRIRSIKTIRMGLFEVERLFKMDPAIKVFYYTRDPRGQLNSRWEIFGYKKEELFIQKLCNKMRDDLLYLDDLLERYPDNFFLTRYEDLVNDTVEFSTKVYQEIGRPDVPPEVVRYLYENTHAQTSTGVMGTRRKDAEKIPEKWRSKLPADTQEMFAKYCHDIFKKLNYPMQ